MTKSKPRILYVLHSAAERGGTEEHTWDLARTLSERYDTFVVCPYGNQLVLFHDDRPIDRYPADQIAGVIAPLRAGLTENSFSKLLNRVNPDIIHIQHFVYWPLSILEQALKTERPVFLSLHDYYAITPHYTMVGTDDPAETLSSDYSKRILKQDVSGYLSDRRVYLEKTLGQMKALITPSDFVSKWYKRCFPFDYRIIEHGIKPFTILPKIDSATLRFGCLGNRFPQKGWVSIYQAFQQLRQERQDAELHFYGGGQLPTGAVAPGIFFHGSYAPADLGSILANVDIGIIPSLFRESYCLVLSELWRGRVPVGVSAIGALDERVTDDINGKKFPPGDISRIAETLRWFLSNGSWRSWRLPKPRLLNEMAADYDQLYQSNLLT